MEIASGNRVRITDNLLDYDSWTLATYLLATKGSIAKVLSLDEYLAFRRTADYPKPLPGYEAHNAKIAQQNLEIETARIKKGAVYPVQLVSIAPAEIELLQQGVTSVLCDVGKILLIESRYLEVA